MIPAVRIAYNSVSIEKIDPRMIPGFVAVAIEFTLQGFDCWITSGDDGLHSTGSLHYPGTALDFRTRHVPPAKRREIARRLGKHLSPIYDVVLESTHLHVEYDPPQRKKQHRA